MTENYAISWKTTWQHILSDIARYRVTEKRSAIACFIMSPGVIAGIYYRIGHWIWYAEGSVAPWLHLLRPFYIIGKRFIEIYSGISISPQARIGRGLYFNHFGSIFIGASTIGENGNFAHETTIGFGGRGEKSGRPTLGDRVLLGPGAKVLGQITLGNDVAVGANAVVTSSLPDLAVAVGAPARIVSYKGSLDYIVYDGMEHDAQRLENLKRRANKQHDRTGTDTAETAEILAVRS